MKRGTIGTLSASNKAVLAGIQIYWDVNGIPPTVRDLCTQLHIASTSTIHHHLDRLERLGYIQRRPGIPRSIRITQKGAPNAA